MSKKRVISVLFLFVLILVTAGNFGIKECQADENEGIYIEKIETNESKILSSKELKAIIFAYEGKVLTMAEIENIVSKINELYINKGYITARAILPAQKIEDKILRIKLIEGRAGKIILEGNKDTKDKYFRKRISLKPGNLLNLDKLQDELFYFNATNDVNVKAELKAGEEYGETDLVLKIREPKKFQGTFFADNSGRNETGLIRSGITIANKSLTGHRDNLNLMFLVGKGTQAGTLSYNFPFTKAGARATINYNKNVTDIISGEYESVNIKGDYEEYGLSISRPLFVIKGFKIDGNLKYHKKISDTFFSGVNLLTTDIENQILNITSRFNKGDRVWYTNHNLVMGKSSSGKDDYSDPGVSDEFIKYNAYFENQRIMEDESLFTFKTYLQASDNKLLPSSEQFSLGGMSTVRGFPEGKLIGDQGYYISAEISATVNERTNLFVFLDHGGVFPYKGNDETINEDDYLTGTGMGIIKNFTEKVSGKFVLGLPIDEEELPKLHFALQAIW